MLTHQEGVEELFAQLESCPDGTPVNFFMESRVDMLTRAEIVDVQFIDDEIRVTLAKA